MRCSFCSYEFDEEAARRECGACSLLVAGCRMFRCPECGYETPVDPPLVAWFRRKTAQIGKQKKMSLLQVKAGSTGTVLGFLSDDENLLRKLLVMGVLPGIRLSVTHTSPLPVIRIGWSEFAIDRELANAVAFLPES